MKKSILFLVALVIVSTDFIAQGSIQDQEKQKTTQTDTAAKHKKMKKEGKKDRSSNKKEEQVRKMDNYESNTPAGTSPSEQQHMDSTINNHR